MRRASTKTREATPKVAVQHMTSFTKFRSCVTLDEIYVDRLRCLFALESA